nr:proline-rich receptor-like protein kinase PERK2 [Rhipicephalus microplus]
MWVHSGNMIFLLGILCLVSLLQGPAPVEGTIGRDGHPIYAKLKFRPGAPPAPVPRPGTYHTPVKGMKKPPPPSRLLKPGPPDPKRHLKPPPALPPRGRPQVPPRVGSLAK